MAEKTAADSCHLVNCESLQKGSRRWVRSGSPRCLDDTWIPAFPHKGNQKDVAKLKHLLKILARDFLKGSPTFSPFLSQIALLATSEQTGERDSIQATLKCMVQILKQLASFLVKNCAPPTVHELRLYGLILRHVESYMLLYLMEESSKQDVVPTELFDHSVTRVGSFLADNHIDVDESVLDSFDDSDSDFFNVWNGFNKLVLLLKDYVSSISKISVDEGATVLGPAICGGTTDIKAGVGGHTSTPESLILTTNFDAGG